MNREKLQTEQEHALWQRLSSVWGIDTGAHYWFPLAEIGRTDVEAYQATYLLRALLPLGLQAILRKRGVTTVLEFREGGGAWQVPLEDFDPSYDGEEGFWATSDMDWILYASHEASITIGGNWLIGEVRRAWPESDGHIWTTPSFK